MNNASETTVTETAVVDVIILSKDEDSTEVGDDAFTLSFSYDFFDGDSEILINRNRTASLTEAMENNGYAATDSAAEHEDAWKEENGLITAYRYTDSN